MENLTTSGQNGSVSSFYDYILYIDLAHFFLALTCNSFTLTVLKREDSGFEATTKLICYALLLADDLAMFSVTFEVALRVAPVQHQEAVCISAYLSFIATFTLSFIYTCLLSLDRLIQVWRPFVYLARATERLVKMILLIATLLPMLDLAVLAFTWQQNEMLVIDCGIREYAKGKIRWTIRSYMLMMLAAGISVVMHILSLVVAFRVLTANRIAHLPVGGSGSSKSDSSGREDIALDVDVRNAPGRLRHLKGIITVLILVTSTLSASLPMVLVIGLDRLSESSHVPDWALLVAFTLASCNTWFKGFIFVFTNRQFRQAAKAEIKKIKNLFKCD